MAFIGLAVTPAQAAISVGWNSSKTYSLAHDGSLSLTSDYVTHSSNNVNGDGTFSSISFATSTSGCQIVSGVLSLTSSATRAVESCSVTATVSYTKKSQTTSARNFTVSWPALPELAWSGEQYFEADVEVDLLELSNLSNAEGNPTFSLAADSACSIREDSILVAPVVASKCRVTASFTGATSADRDFFFILASWSGSGNYSVEAGETLDLSGSHSATDGSSIYGTALSIGDENSAGCSVSGSSLSATRAGSCDVVATHSVSGAKSTKSISVTGSSGDFSIRWGAGPFEFAISDDGLTPASVLAQLVLPGGLSNASAELSLGQDSNCSLSASGSVLRDEPGHCEVVVTVRGNFAGNASAEATHAKSFLAYELAPAVQVDSTEAEFVVSQVSATAQSVRSLVADLTGIDQSRLTGFTRLSTTESRNSFRCTIDSLGDTFLAKAKQVCVVGFTVTKRNEELYREVSDSTGTITLYVLDEAQAPEIEFLSRARSKFDRSPVVWGAGSELALRISAGRNAHPEATLSYATSQSDQCEIADDVEAGEQVVSVLEDATASDCTVVAALSAVTDRINLVKYPEVQSSLSIQILYASGGCTPLDGYSASGIAVQPLGGAYFLIDKTEPAREQDEQFPIDLNYLGYRVSGQSQAVSVSISDFAAESNRRNVQSALQPVGATTVSEIESGSEAYFTITPVDPLKIAKTSIPQSHIVTVSTAQNAVLHKCKFIYSGIRESDPHSTVASDNETPLVNRIVSIVVTDNTREVDEQKYLEATVTAESNQIIRRSANNSKDFWNLSPAARVSNWPVSGVTMVSSVLRFGNMSGGECVITNPSLTVSGGIEYRLSRGENFGYDCVEGNFRFKVATSLIGATLAEGIQVESVSHVQAGGELDHSRQRVASHKWGYRTELLDDESQTKTYNAEEQDFFVDIDKFGVCAQSMNLPEGLEFWSATGLAPWTHVVYKRTWVGSSQFQVASGPCEESPVIQEVIDLDFTVEPLPIGIQFWAFDKDFDDTIDAGMMGMNLHGHYSQDSISVHQRSNCPKVEVRFTNDDPAQEVPILVICRSFTTTRIHDGNVAQFFQLAGGHSPQYVLTRSIPMPADIRPVVTPPNPPVTPPAPTPTPTASPTPTPTPTPTESPAPTPSPTESLAPTPSPTPTVSPTPTPTPTNIAAPQNQANSAQRTTDSLAQEVIGGFAPETGITIQVTGTRTVGQFVITSASSADPIALAAALAESTARNATNFAQIQNVSSVAQPPKFTDEDLPKVDDSVLRAFAESGLAAPKGLDMSQVNNSKSWLKIDALATDFLPGSLVYLTVTSDPILLGFAEVSENGSILVSGYLPLEVLPEGGHNIRVVGTRSFDGIFADENGEIQLSEEALTEIQKFDPGTKATVLIEGQSTSGGTVTAMREVLLHKDVPWWTVWLAAIVALLAFFSLLFRRPSTARRKQVTALVALVGGIPAFWLGWVTYSYEVMFLGSAIAALSALVIAGPAAVWSGLVRIVKAIRGRRSTAEAAV